ncbi:aminopeptidase O isoform X4 [Nelusetta ayraudi]|uniref:aminopeptidase O isoform X4 n=1 Tax=Nelusetta ayraudi TaxID=303726 RepID=UPI003F6F6053
MQSSANQCFSDVTERTEASTSEAHPFLHSDVTFVNMEANQHLNPDTDDLPLRANASHILVRHYVLNLTVHFERKVMGGSAVLFLEPCPAAATQAESVAGLQASSVLADTERRQSSPSWQTTGDGDFTLVLDCCDLNVSKVEEVDVASASSTFGHLAEDSPGPLAGSSVDLQAALVHKLISVPSGRWRQKFNLFSVCSRAPAFQGGASLEFFRDRWSLQVRKKGVASPQQFPRAVRICYETEPAGGSVRWTKDQDNRLCVYTAGSPINNRALFPCQEPPVAMSTWQATVRAPCDCLVLMSGEEQCSPIEEGDPPLLTWNYHVTMPMPASTFTLAVGHWQQVPAEIPSVLEGDVGDSEEQDEPAKLGAGPRQWTEAECGLGSSTSEVVKGTPPQTGREDQTTRSAFRHRSPEDEGHSVTDYSGTVDDGIPCSHGDYPCRFAECSAASQRVIPHRVFGPACLLQKAQTVLQLLPPCLAAAHSTLGVHPFPRLDVLIVPAGFSSLGMASPHIIFLSQSVLHAGSSSSAENGLSLCGSRICHEIAHAWFGLVIGAKDWTEEWISEGFATYLEDIIWAKAQKLSSRDAEEESELKALLRWRRLADELKNSEEGLQILRPNMGSTGQVSESGSSTVKHALNPDKAFMQVHYLKGYFLLRFLADQVGERQFIRFFRSFVKKYHGQLVLSQDFLQMLLITFPNIERKGLTLTAIYADWLDRPGIPKWLCERSAVWSQARLVEEVKAEVTSEQLVMLLELLLEEEEELSQAAMEALQRTYNLQSRDAEVRHRWCELVIKHEHRKAYRDVEHFLLHDQAMGVYLYGELMLQENPQQQELARRCLSLAQGEMDQSARRVVEEMVL